LVTEITTDLVFGTLLIIIIMSWGKEWKCAVSCISSCSRATAEATVYSEKIIMKLHYTSKMIR